MPKNTESTTKFKADISELKAAMQEASRAVRLANSEFKAATSGMDDWSKSADGLSAKTKQLKSVLSAQNTQLKSLEKQYELTAKEQGENSRGAEELKIKINNQKAAIAQTESQLDKYEKALDDVGKETKEAGDAAKEAANGGFTVLKGVVANLAAEAIKTAINGLKKLGSELIDVGKQAYSAYASYEQLTGGVETLFGESADIVKEYAENAYKTASMSANTYMETVTSFSASLLQGLNGDTAKAAKIADQAITDMSDNANKMGTSMESIQNAYQGFAKQNYSMLDNLKLGYGGTKAEMARLVKESGILGKAGEDLTAKNLDQKVSFDQIIEAIHVVQTNMGITGTTAKEASSTIEGSANSMKAAWENLMVDVAKGNANMSKSVEKFTDSVETYVGNAAPRVKTIAQGLLKTVKKLARKYMPEIANTVFPVIEKLTKAIKTVAKFTIDNFDKIAPVVMTAVAAFTTFNAVMAISKTVTAVTTAVSGLTAGVGLATKAQTIWNAVLAANPIGAVITAVAALTAAVVLLAGKQNEATKAHKEEMAALEEQRDEINSNVQAWDDLKKAQQEQINSGMTELSYYDSLKKELDQIVDKNGKVKKGYEERASFITSQLSDAMGIEIENVDGVIQKYDDVIATIDRVMEKKKAQIILDSQESLYKEAINKQTQALMDLNAMQDEYKTKKGELEAYEKLYAEASESLLNSRSASEGKYYIWQMDMIQGQIDAKNEELNTVKSNYDQQQDLLSKYAYNIGQYEKNMQLAHAGNYDAMSTVTWDYVKDYQSADNAQRQMLEDSITAEETNLKLLKKLKADGNTDIYDQQIKQSEKRLEQQKKELEQYKTTTKEGLDKVKVEWSEGLDAQLSELTGRKVEFKDVGSGMVRMYVDGVSSLNAVSKQEMARLVTDTINEISLQYTHAEEAGQDLIDGVNKGIANEKKQSGVFSTISSFGQNLLEKLKKSLKEKSPSKATDEMGQFLLDGLGNGIDKKENDLIKQVSSVGENVLDALDSELSQGITFDPVRIIKDFGKLINNAIPGIDLSQLISSRQLELSNVPLNQNKKWIATTAKEMNQALTNQGVITGGNNATSKTINFYQTNNSPKALDALTVYRETNSLLFSAGVKLNNV